MPFRVSEMSESFPNKCRRTFLAEFVGSFRPTDSVGRPLHVIPCLFRLFRPPFIHCEKNVSFLRKSFHSFLRRLRTCSNVSFLRKSFHSILRRLTELAPIFSGALLDLSALPQVKSHVLLAFIKQNACTLAFPPLVSNKILEYI